MVDKITDMSLPKDRTAILNGSEKTILVVEDDRTHRSLMEKILTDCNFTVVPAENGMVAMSKLDSGQDFDLILMDCDMPQMNGLETTSAIRALEQREGRHHTPIVAFTASRQEGYEEKCLAAGMDAYMTKDVWMPRWQSTLINNLNDLIMGGFDQDMFTRAYSSEDNLEISDDYDLDNFDKSLLDQTAGLLKDELVVAVDEFVEDATAYVRGIRAGQDSGDMEEVARNSHPLKSNSRSFGLVAVSHISEVINKAALENDAITVSTLVPKLEDAFQRAENILQNALKQYGF